MQFKSCPVRVKAAGEADGLEDGQFEAIVSVFGNKDSYGDVVMPGAFTDTIAEWKASGNPIPVYYSHRMDDPDFNIGHVLEAKEVDEGLWVKAQIDLDPEAKKAAQVYRLLKGNRLTQFSFAYDVIEGSWAKRAGDDGEPEEYYELRKLKVYEVGPTPIGANQATELLAVKAFAERAERFAVGVKAGRELSAKNIDMLTDVAASAATISKSINELLARVTGEDSEDGKAKPSEPAKDEEPTRAKSEEPMRLSPASMRLRCDLTAAAAGLTAHDTEGDTL